jgi:shikimate dehydrogenase
MTAAESTALYGLIGNPVSHSLSPFIMNQAFRHRGMDAIYMAFSVKPELLSSAIGGFAAVGAAGFNVTFPFKEAVLENVDILSPDAELIHAVNTLVLSEDKIHGHNTDAPGTAYALEVFASLSLDGKHVFIFGAGGAGRAAACGVLQKGAQSVTFGVRSPDKARVIAERYRARFSGQKVGYVLLQDSGAADLRQRAFERADLVINATPVGMGVVEESTLIENADWVSPRQCFFDFVYHPGNTAFLESAGSRGARTLGGLTLLVSQAAVSFRLWTGQSFEVKEMLETVESFTKEEIKKRGGSTKK